MSLNFCTKKFLPLSPAYKRSAKWRPEIVTIPSIERLFIKLRTLKQHHNLNQGSRSSQPSISRILELVTDFDYTITKHINPFAQKGDTYSDVLFSPYGKSNYLPAKFREELTQNYSKYGPYQTDGSISFQERVKIIDHLYHVQLSLFKKHFITFGMVNKVTQQSNVIFRAYSKQLFRECLHLKIPVYVVSGAVSDMIQSMVRGLFYQKDTNRKLQNDIINNISIHSNELQIWKPQDASLVEIRQNNPYINGEEQFVKFKQSILHSYNRFKVMKELPIANPNTKEPIESQNEVIVDSIIMGDLISDINLSRNKPQSTNLSIFFAKEGQTDQRALAEQNFDLIIESDGSHRIVIEMLKIIRGDSDRVDWLYVQQVNKALQRYLKWI